MLILTMKRDGRKADYKFKKAMIEECKKNGTIKPGNKINDYEFRDDPDASAIREKCNFTTRDGRTFEFWVEWGYQTSLKEIKEPITY